MARRSVRLVIGVPPHSQRRACATTVQRQQSCRYTAVTGSCKLAHNLPPQYQRRSKMMYQRSSLTSLLVLCATLVSMASASAVAGGMHHAPSDPLAAMATYARFAHEVISLPAAAAKAQQKNQRNLQFTDGRWTQMASMCGAVGELGWPDVMSVRICYFWHNILQYARTIFFLSRIDFLNDIFPCSLCARTFPSSSLLPLTNRRIPGGRRSMRDVSRRRGRWMLLHRSEHLCLLLQHLRNHRRRGGMCRGAMWSHRRRWVRLRWMWSLHIRGGVLQL